MKRHSWKRMWARNYGLFLSAAYMEAFKEKSRFGASRNKLFIPEGKLYAMYFDSEELRTMIEAYSCFLLHTDPGKYTKRYEEEFRKFLAWSRKSLRKDFTKLSHAALAAQVTKLYKKCIEFSEMRFYPFLVVNGIAEEVTRVLQNRPDLLRAITTPFRYTKTTKARVVFLNLVKERKMSTVELQRYATRYAWLPMSDFTDTPLSLKEVTEQASDIRDASGELAVIAAEHKKGLIAYHAFLNTVHDRRFKKLVEITHHFSYLKEMRDDYRRPFYLAWRPFWQEIALRIGVPFEATNYLLPHELFEALTKGTNYGTLASARMDTFALQLAHGALHAYSGIEAEVVARTVLPTTQNGSMTKGFCASKGKIVGAVKVIFHRAEFGKFNEGDVLVTTMTHPEFLPLLKKAAAVVTDEGGITCHAAIVSRELNKPCIIGTKNATQVLKDGDMVEVDADKGVVRKL